MTQILEVDSDQAVPRPDCGRCHRRTRLGWNFAFKNTAPTTEPTTNDIAKCLRCALLHPPMLRRSILTALVVGSLLTALNQGNTLASGVWNSEMFWKIPLTYCVPFCVATYVALANAKR